MDIITFRHLLSPAGQEALQIAQSLKPQESTFLQHYTALKRRFPSDLARAALETAILRAEATDKFPLANEMYFTRPALEQASGHLVAEYRAQRYRNCELVADLGCSIGSDTLALAAVTRVVGIDLDPVRLALASANSRTAGLGGRASFLLADLRQPLPLAPQLGLFFDPARRSNGRRIFSVRDYLPPLATIQSWLPYYPAMGIKISPGVDLQEISGYEAEVEFISLKGDLKEAVLWFGPLKAGLRRATLLPEGHTLSDEDGPGLQPDLPLSEPRQYIYEPDPAILRAGLVKQLGSRLEAAQLDPDIAYLTSDRLVATPFAHVYAVEGWLPFNLKRLRTALRERQVGRLTVKKRGSPLEPEALIRDLRLEGSAERVIFLTHLRGRPIVILSTGRTG